MKHLIAKVWKNEFYKGGVFLTISSFGVNIINYFFNLIVGRSLGPQGYGEIATLFSYVTIASIPITVLSTIIAQKVASHEADQVEYTAQLEDFFWRKVRQALPIIILLIFLTPFIPRITNLLQTGYFLPFIIIAALIGSYYNSLLQGIRMFFLLSVITFVATIVKLLGAFSLILPFGSIITVIFFLLLSYISIFVGNKIALSGKHIHLKKEELTTIEHSFLHILKSKQFIITSFSIIAISLFGNLDIIFVKKFLSPHEAGIYSTWSLFGKLILYVVGPLLQVSFIFFASKLEKDKQNKTLIIASVLIFLIGVGAYFFYLYFSPLLIHTIYGSKFDDVIGFLPSAGIFGAFYTLIMFLNNYFLAQKSISSLILFSGTPIYIILLFLLPHTLPTVMWLNVAFSFVVALTYLIAWGGAFFYNKHNGQ